MQLNVEKCKVMIINFKRSRYAFSPLTVDESVSSGYQFLKWNNHVEQSIKKANKLLYFIVLLRRARVPVIDIKFCTKIIS